MYVLRHEPGELGGAEAILARAALARVPEAERAQRLRLQAAPPRGTRAARARRLRRLRPAGRHAPHPAGLAYRVAGAAARQRRLRRLRPLADCSAQGGVRRRQFGVGAALEWRWWPTGERRSGGGWRRPSTRRPRCPGRSSANCWSCPPSRWRRVAGARAAADLAHPRPDERVSRGRPHVFPSVPPTAGRGAMLARSMLPTCMSGWPCCSRATCQHPGLERGFRRCPSRRERNRDARGVPAGKASTSAATRATSPGSSPTLLLWDGESREGAALLKRWRAAGG